MGRERVNTCDEREPTSQSVRLERAGQQKSGTGTMMDAAHDMCVYMIDSTCVSAFPDFFCVGLSWISVL